ncbi:MAG: hypothetical protein QXQ53_01555 [Candidatus Methanosuratincola sp.]
MNAIARLAYKGRKGQVADPQGSCKGEAWSEAASQEPQELPEKAGILLSGNYVPAEKVNAKPDSYSELFFVFFSIRDHSFFIDK